MNPMAFGIGAVERGLVPDGVTRMAIRRLCRARLHELHNGNGDVSCASNVEFVKSLRKGPIAPVPEMANQQHYELPSEFFGAILGPHRKYSCCYFPSDDSSLAEAEQAALSETCRHAELADGQEVLELGCGWGSLSLWMAKRFPHSQITVVSNSASQGQCIAREAELRELGNLRVVTADMNEFSPGKQTFDRVVSVEMFEHMRNYELLLGRIASWLQPRGKLFIHIFCHRRYSYTFETDGAANWMGRHFFTGGMMPGASLLSQFNRDLTVTHQYAWNGRHYQRTAEAWLANLDRRRDDVLPILATVYGTTEARHWLNRWRMFFLSVAELFAFSGGEEWYVSHYLLDRVS